MYMFVQSMDDEFKCVCIQLDPDDSMCEDAHHIKRP